MRKVHTKYSLHSHNTFRIESTAGYFSEPEDIKEIKALLEYTTQRRLQILIIGEGSNLLFKTDFEGMVIHPKIMGIQKIDESGSEVLVKVGAGENWDNFVAHCVGNLWYGPENLSLIPGSVGSAPVQNIGAYGKEAKDLIEYVEVFDLHTGEIDMLSNQACEFGYRDSIFKHGPHNNYLVTAVVFRLKLQAELLLDYGNVKEHFNKRETQNLSSLRDTIIEIRKQKLPDPEEFGNAGSFFKNPVITASQFGLISSKYEKVPHYPLANGDIKVPAAWLIDQCGWKGKKDGHVGSWPNQPLVLVNYGHATGEEIFLFSEKIANSVENIFNIQLEREVRVIA